MTPMRMVTEKDSYNRYIAVLLLRLQEHSMLPNSTIRIFLTVSSKSVHWEAGYGISNIFQHGGCLPFWILKIITFDHKT